MDTEACCTCASLLSSIPPTYDEKTEKPAHFERRLDCCGRLICTRCISDNPRFGHYCPFCQVTSGPSLLPQGLRDPPAYSPPSSPKIKSTPLENPPPYSEVSDTVNILPEKHASRVDRPAEDVLHFIDADKDSVGSLSLQYGVPSNALRKKNNLYSDYLLSARRTILIPGEFYKGGVSLSPRPVEGEEEELRKSKVRKWMVACKVVEYDVALLYLRQTDYDLELAVEAYKSDEKWEKDHPLEAAKRGKAKEPKKRSKWGVAGGLTGQLR